MGTKMTAKPYRDFTTAELIKFYDTSKGDFGPYVDALIVRLKHLRIEAAAAKRQQARAD